MKVAKTLILLLCAALAVPVASWGADVCSWQADEKETATVGNSDVELARRYAARGDWKDAETHFVAAAKDKPWEKEALGCIETARRNEDATVLQAGQIYEAEHVWTKAEDLYRAAAADSFIGAETRAKAADRLKVVLQAESGQRTWTEWKDRVQDAVEVAVFLLALVLLAATVRAIWKSRRMILIHPFAAPTDELAKGMNIHLRYARERMRYPALSPAGQMPATLVENLLTFDDEVEPIEDLDVAGSKIPFSSLSKLFGRPSIHVSGGFDGVAPLGHAYSLVRTHRGPDGFLQRTIRVGVASEQRLDLLDFAYHVIVRASTAYANL